MKLFSEPLEELTEADINTLPLVKGHYAHTERERVQFLSPPPIDWERLQKALV